MRDTARVEYLEAHFHQAAEAVASGVPCGDTMCGLSRITSVFGYSKRLASFCRLPKPSPGIKDSGLGIETFSEKSRKNKPYQAGYMVRLVYSNGLFALLDQGTYLLNYFRRSKLLYLLPETRCGNIDELTDDLTARSIPHC